MRGIGVTTSASVETQALVPVFVRDQRIQTRGRGSADGQVVIPTRGAREGDTKEEGEGGEEVGES